MNRHHYWTSLLAFIMLLMVLSAGAFLWIVIIRLVLRMVS